MNYQELKKNIRDAARGFKKGLTKVRVLVVEYDDTSSRMLTNVLKSIGFQLIITSKKTSHALDLIERDPFDIYFINYRLMGEDLGINLIDHLYGYGYQEKAITFLILKEKEKIPPDFPPEYHTEGILQKPYKVSKICTLVSDACTKKLVRLETTQLVSANKEREAIVLNLQTTGKSKSKVWGTLAAGQIYEKKENYENAVTLYRAILKIYPNCAIAFDAIGLVLRKLERNMEAEHNFLSSANKNPYYLRAKHHLAELYYRNGEKEKARKILQLALRINPMNVVTNKDLAQVSMDLEDYESAKRALKVVLQDHREGENPNVLIDYGNALMMNNELDDAIENFNKSLNHCKTQEDVEEHSKVLKSALTAKGNCYLKFDDPEKKKLAAGCFHAAEKAMNKVEVSEEDRDEFKLSVGNSYLEQGMDDEAGTVFSEFIDKDPKNKTRQKKVTGIYKLFDKVQSAVDLIEKAVQKAMDNIAEKDKENRKLRKEGKFREAVESYEELIKRYPSDDGLYFNCGRTYMEWAKKLGEGSEEGMEKKRHAYLCFKSALDLDQERISPALDAIGIDKAELAKARDHAKKEIAVPPPPTAAVIELG